MVENQYVFEHSFASYNAGPRVLTVGEARDGLGRPRADLRSALSDGLSAGHIPARSVARHGPALLRAGARAANGGVEAIHVFDARFAPFALVSRRRYGIAASASLSPRDISDRTLPAIIARLMLPRFDQVLACDATIVARAFAPRRMPLAVLPPLAAPLAPPSPRALATVARIVEGVTPGRLTISVLWPRDSRALRRFRDAVAPLLIGNPVVLVLGAPSRRQARLMLGAYGMRRTFRVHAGPVDADLLSAAARYSDALVLAGSPRRLRGDDDIVLALSASGVPFVASGELHASAIDHERSALSVEPGDTFGLVSTLNKLLALPAEQRHALGGDFAAYTLDRWSAPAVSEAARERFHSLVGRPLIPASLRAA